MYSFLLKNKVKRHLNKFHAGNPLYLQSQLHLPHIPSLPDGAK